MVKVKKRICLERSFSIRESRGIMENWLHLINKRPIPPSPLQVSTQAATATSQHSSHSTPSLLLSPPPKRGEETERRKLKESPPSKKSISNPPFFLMAQLDQE